MIITLFPSLASFRAVAALMLVFPTPPFPVYNNILILIITMQENACMKLLSE